MKKAICSFLVLLLALTAFSSCENKPSEGTGAPDSPEIGATLNGVALSEYVIVYAPDFFTGNPNERSNYNQRAAQYISDCIYEATGIALPVQDDTKRASPHEILVGETLRPLSEALDADTAGLSFALLADESGIAMEADRFVIAAAAYYFVETYITGDTFEAAVPTTVTVAEPITEKPKNVILLIGDGMGQYQTRLFDYAKAPAGTNTFGENRFFGYMLPYIGEARTNSLSGTTDSAAGGTALATGYKTYNSYIGQNGKGENVLSLTELALALGKSAAVMTTDNITGATPAAFSAHASNRSNTEEIKTSQAVLDGAILRSLSDPSYNRLVRSAIDKVLQALNGNENGFFLMYEEAHIDKHSHNNDLDSTFKALLRFNCAIAHFMEYAFYHPDTMVIITADHETGNLKPSGGNLTYHDTGHSSSNVPVFAYGEGAEVFHSKAVENVQIPKTVAAMWGYAPFGDADFPALIAD